MDFSIIYYFLPAILAVFGALCFDFSSKHIGKKVLWAIIYIYLILFMGLRYEVGGDTLTYMSWYEWAHDLKNWHPFDVGNVFEPGFTFLVACVKSLSDGSFYWFQLLHAFILNTCIFYFIAKNTKYRFSALLIAFLTYYLYFSTEILREAIAIFIFIFNFNSFVKHKWGRYYLGVACCIPFHLSSSFLLVLPILANLKFNKSYFRVIIIFCALCLVLQPIFVIISNIVPAVGAKAIGYGKHTNVGYLWAGLRILQFSIIPLITLILCKRIFYMTPKYEIAYLILILLGIGIAFIPIIFQRFTNYFYPLLALSLADVICKNIRSVNLNKRLASLILSIIIFFSFGYYYLYLDFYQMWLPYSSVLDPHSYTFRYRFFGGGNN